MRGNFYELDLEVKLKLIPNSNRYHLSEPILLVIVAPIGSRDIEPL